jgi:hypothetical protein
MKIAILAWGSLVERPGTLRLASIWQPGGPQLPVEFSRRSKDDRLTLVIDTANGRPVPTQFATSALTTLDAAVEDLRKREKTSTENIGFATLSRQCHRQTVDISRWLATSDFDAVIWTALPSNFLERVGDPFSVERAVAYLRALPADAQRTAFEYFRIAPPNVMTPLRERLIADGLLQ